MKQKNSAEPQGVNDERSSSPASPSAHDEVYPEVPISPPEDSVLPVPTDPPSAGTGKPPEYEQPVD